MTSEERVKSGNIASVVRGVYQSAVTAREEVTERMRGAKLAADAEYGAETLNAISRGANGSKTYYPIIKVKSKSAVSWMNKILASSTKPWNIMPTPEPDLDDRMVERVTETALREGERLKLSGFGEMTEDDYYQFANDMRNLIVQYRNEEARKAADKAEIWIDDKLVEANFKNAFAEFLSDFCLYPTAFLRCKRVLDSVEKAERVGEDFVYVKKVEERLEMERVSPMRVFPAAGAMDCNDGNLVIVSLYSLSELSDMAKMDGYNANAIREVIRDYAGYNSGNSGYDDSLTEYPEAKLFGGNGDKYRKSGKIAGLEYYGSVSGKDLYDWGIEVRPELDSLKMIGMEDSDAEIEEKYRESLAKVSEYLGFGDGKGIDEYAMYEVYAIVVRDKCIYCRIVPEERFHNHRMIFCASWERNGDSIWGYGIADILKYVQEDTNSVRRATINNLALSSYPQQVINDDAIVKTGPNRSNDGIYPGKVWHVKSTWSGNGNKPVDFFNIPTTYQALHEEFSMLLALADRVSGIPEYAQGLSQGAVNGAAGTASGLAMLLEAAGNYIKDPVANIDRGVIEPLIKSLYRMMMLDPNADPDMKGDYKIRAMGATGLLFKEQATERRKEFLQLILQSQLLQQIVKPEGINALVRELANGLDMPVDKFVSNETELLAQMRQQEEEQKMMQEQQMAQMQSERQNGENGEMPENAPYSENTGVQGIPDMSAQGEY